MNALELTIIVIVSALDLALGIVVLARNSQSRTHRLFAATALAMVAWMVINFMCDQPAFVTEALTLNRLAVAAAVLMGLPLFAFVISYPRNKARLTWGWRLLLLPIPVIVIATVLTPWAVRSVRVEDWGTNVTTGPVFTATLVWGLCACAALATMMVRRFRRADARQRTQLGYLYLGIGAFLVTTIVLGGLLPAVTGSNELAQFLPIATVLFLAPTGYAAIRHQLMDVHVVVLRAVSYSAVMLLSGAAFLIAAEVGQRHVTERYGVDPRAIIFVTGLGAVLAFQFLRGRLEQATDRVFYRITYDPTALLNRLGTEMGSTLDEAELAQFLASTLASEMRLEFASVSYTRSDTTCTAHSSPSAPTGDLLALLASSEATEIIVADAPDAPVELARTLCASDIRVLAPLHGDGELIGAIALGPKSSGAMFSKHDLRFLEVLVPEAYIAMKTARLFDEKTQRVRELTALNELSYALSTRRNLDSILTGAIEQVAAVTQADSGSIMLLDESEPVLTIAASVGISARIARWTRIPIGEGIAGWVAEHREPLVLINDTDVRFQRELLREEISSAICVPVMANDTVVGVLNLNRRKGADLFTDENRHVIASFAGQLGIAIENARLYTDLEATFLGTISALAAAVDAKDPYTFGHSQRVTQHAVGIAEALGLDPHDVQMVRIAATLHDIGKIGIDSAILLKPGRLTEQEREAITRHSAIGADILAPLDFLRDAVPLVLFHHERYGGGGYPSGISGEAIPIGARIISIADSFEAMRSDRPYRKALSHEAAIAELNSNAGGQFDPELVDVFLRLLAEEDRSGSSGNEALPREAAVGE